MLYFSPERYFVILWTTTVTIISVNVSKMYLLYYTGIYKHNMAWKWISERSRITRGYGVNKLLSLQELNVCVHVHHNNIIRRWLQTYSKSKRVFFSFIELIIQHSVERRQCLSSICRERWCFGKMILKWSLRDSTGEQSTKLKSTNVIRGFIFAAAVCFTCESHHTVDLILNTFFCIYVIHNKLLHH